MNDCMTSLEQALNGQVLRYAVSRAIFCPVCETVLDVNNAVLYFPRDTGRGSVAAHASAPVVLLCGPCSDRMRDRATSIDDATLLARYEITDGRV